MTTPEANIESLRRLYEATERDGREAGEDLEDAADLRRARGALGTPGRARRHDDEAALVPGRTQWHPVALLREPFDLARGERRRGLGQGDDWSELVVVQEEFYGKPIC